jgi:Methyl-accepting chemotaxis protein (MCP) signalling domain
MRSAKGISTQVREPSNFADQASAAAQEARASVDRLRESSAAIGNVVDLIAQIARQTTLLALNSTIEAARAGAAAKVLRLSPPRSRRWPCKRRARPKRSPKRSARSKRMSRAPLSGCSNCCLLSLPDANTSSRAVHKDRGQSRTNGAASAQVVPFNDARKLNLPILSSSPASLSRSPTGGPPK